MKKLLAICLVWALILSLSACCINTDQMTTYTASFTAYIQNKTLSDTYISSSDLATSQRLTETYAAIIKSNSVLEAVAKKFDTYISTALLRDMLEITQVENTEVLKISVTADDSQLALSIAQTLAEVIPEEIAQIVEGSSVKIVDSPTVTENTSIFNLLP